MNTLVFDLDGTLVDSSAGIEYAGQVAVRILWPGRELPSFRQRIGPPIRDTFQQLLPDATPEELNQLELHFRVTYDNKGWRKSVAYPGVGPSLRRLCELGQQCFVVTNKPTCPARRILEWLELMAYFKEVVSPDSKIPPFSSKADMTAYVLAKYGLDARQTLFVGDSADDARAAQSCGLQFAAAAYGYGCAYTHDLPKDYVLSEIAALVPIVSRLVSI
ncbi:MAG: HAD hydrolase-like protein [Acidobacteria bacterium]|nr:HAD hydrolase-like protein [Acidobacteriota bacterium]